jgi:hypothetical protein
MCTVSKTVNELYKLESCVVFSLNLLIIFCGPPVFYVAVFIILGALVVKSVGHLVANYHPDTAVVDRVVCRKIKIRILQDARREHNFINEVGCNKPLQLMAWCPIQFCQPAYSALPAQPGSRFVK